MKGIYRAKPDCETPFIGGEWIGLPIYHEDALADFVHEKKILFAGSRLSRNEWANRIRVWRKIFGNGGYFLVSKDFRQFAVIEKDELKIKFQMVEKIHDKIAVNDRRGVRSGGRHSKK